MPSFDTQEQPERLFLVYVNADDAEDDYVEQELEGLAEAVGAEVVGETRQRITKPHRANYIGTGKVEEIMNAATLSKAETVIIDAELTGAQIRNLEEVIQCRVIDRNQLILDIFARRAATREGQLQVELAQLTYRLPRLMSFYTKFERQRGGIGMRGPGETKLESDRRMITNRISKLKGEIDDVRKHREQQRTTRKAQPFPDVALVGYTSAGKSTLMNALADSSLLADAMPFATLDPTTRKIDLAHGFSFYLSDTVGFIRNLPTQLVAAFRATLEEVSEADLLLHIIDVSHPEWEIQRDSVLETLSELGASEIPMLSVYNKVDLLSDEQITELMADDPENTVAVSALNGRGIPELIAKLEQHATKDMQYIHALLPHDKSDLIDQVYKLGTVESVDYKEDGIHLKALVSPEIIDKFKPYSVK